MADIKALLPKRYACLFSFFFFSIVVYIDIVSIDRASIV